MAATMRLITDKSTLLFFILLSLAYLIPLAASQACNTNSNPYCRGVAQFEALCCPYPNVCYWSNRNGQPACCPAGQNCQANAAASIATTQHATPISTITVTSTSTLRGAATTPAAATTFVGVVAGPIPSVATQVQTVTSVTVLQPTTAVSQPAVLTTVTTGVAAAGQGSVSGVFVTVTQVQFVGGCGRSRDGGLTAMARLVMWIGMVLGGLLEGGDF